MLKYKDILAAKGSALYAALQAGNTKMAEKIHKETTANYAAMYSKADRDWFAEMHKSVK